MAISLQKGQSISLDKNQYDLSQITVGLGWDVVEDRRPAQPVQQKKNGFSNRIKQILGVGAGQQRSLYSVKRNNPMLRQDETRPYDLDAIAFLLDEDDKIIHKGSRQPLENGQIVDFVGSDIVFYNNPVHPDGNIYHTGDNRSGEGEGDDEQIIVKLNAMDLSYHKIVFMACIYQGVRKNQHFGLLSNAFIRAMDATGQEIVKYNLSGEPGFMNKRSLIFAHVIRTGLNQWKFQAIGEALETDRFGDVLKTYM
jgi:tellurium resistance protein TerD